MVFLDFLEHKYREDLILDESHQCPEHPWCALFLFRNTYWYQDTQDTICFFSETPFAYVLNFVLCFLHHSAFSLPTHARQWLSYIATSAIPTSQYSYYRNSVLVLFLDIFSSPQINQMPLPLTPTTFNACFNHYPNLSHLTGLPVHTDHFRCPERPGSLWHWEQQLGDFGHCWSLAISWWHYRTTDWTESSAQWTGWWKKLAVWRRLSWSSAVRAQQQPGGDWTRQWWHQMERGRGHSWPAALLLTWKVDKNLMIKKNIEMK